MSLLRQFADIATHFTGTVSIINFPDIALQAFTPNVLAHGPRREKSCRFLARWMTKRYFQIGVSVRQGNSDGTGVLIQYFAVRFIVDKCIR